MAKDWIQKAVKHPGALAAKAKATGMTVSQFTHHPPKGISTATKKEIALAKTLSKLRK